MIKLFKGIKFNNSYDYVKGFETKEERNNYFNNKEYILIDDNNYIKEHVNSFKVHYSYDYLFSNGVNYMMFNNGYKDIFAFIIEKEYVSEDVTKLIYEIDVIQTYMFDFTIGNSFIERKVCNINEITDFDEGLNIGEHKCIGEVATLEKDYEYFAMFNGIKQQELVFENGVVKDVINLPSTLLKPSTMVDGVPYPIHFMKLQEFYLEPTIADINIPSGNIGGVGSDSDFIGAGVISREGFRFIKGFEGFAPRSYKDSGGYLTICYGVTKHGEPDLYNKFVNMQPVSESEGAKESYRLKNERYASKIADRCKELGITKQYQFDALVSLAYNCGNGVVLNDNNLTRAIKENPLNEDKIRPIWEKFYVTSGGVYLSGLHKRRVQECNMFFGKEFEIRPISLITSAGNINGKVTDNNGDGWLPTEV